MQKKPFPRMFRVVVFTPKKERKSKKKKKKRKKGLMKKGNYLITRG